MSNQIFINYGDVRSKVRELRTRLNNEMRDMNAEYRQVQSTLGRMDSRTNAEFAEVVIANQNKAQVTAEALQRLLTFIESSARETEQEERRIKQVFSATMSRRTRTTEGSAD